MNQPLDHQVRTMALDPARSFIVQAPAGSGKTELLVRRYLRLLARVEQPGQILAITFTRKAAAEMRERVVNALRLAAVPLDPEGGESAASPAEPELMRFAREALEQDRKQGWNILSNYSQLRIQTIDSFYSYLVKSLPFRSGFGSDLSITEDAFGLYVEALRELVKTPPDSPYHPALRSTLAHLDNSYATLERLLCDMLQKRDQWLRHLGGIHRPDEFVAVLQRSLKHLQGAELEKLREELDKLPAALQEQWGRLLAWSQRQLAGQLTELGPELPPCDSAFLEHWAAAIELLLTREGGWRAKLDKKQGFPAPSEAGIGSEEKQRRAACKTEALELIGQLSGRAGLRERLLVVRRLPAASYSADELQQVLAIAQVLRLAAAHLQLVFRRQGQVDHLEVALAAGRALGTDGQPSDLALLLDYRLQHILVDEFQDTSQQQFRLLETLLEGWNGADGRSLFLVGDPMQSIYRFREAEVGLFLRANRRGIGGLPIQPLQLRVNFRSQGHLVERSNRLFERIFPRHEEIDRGAVPFAQAEAHHAGSNEEALAYHFSAVHQPWLAAERVATLIREELARGPADVTIAVLVQSRRHLRWIVPALRRARIPFQGMDLESLANAPVVQDLLILTRCLLRFADRTAWLALLRAPWCGLDLHDLTHFAEQVAEGPVWPVLQAGDATPGVSQAGLARLATLRAALAPALAARDKPLQARVESLWLALGGPATLRSSSELEDARAYLELLADLETGGQVDLSLLQRKLQTLYARPDAAANGQVQVMTIHRSKGLQFDTVIIPGLESGARKDDRPLLAWLERVADDRQATLLLAPIRAPGGEEAPVFGFINDIRKDQAAQELIRLLYVAITRAKQRVHLCGALRFDQDGEVRKPASGTLLALLWPDAEEAASRQMKTIASPGLAAVDAGVPNTDRLRRLPLAWSRPAGGPELRWSLSRPVGAAVDPPLPFDWAGATARQIGTVAHRCLQRLGETGPPVAEGCAEALRPLIATWLIEAGVPAPQQAEAVERVRAIVERVAGDPRGRWILSSGHRHGSVEFRVSGLPGGQADGQPINRIIDRTFVDDQGTRWIIDYKTGDHGGGGVEQFLDNEQLRYHQRMAEYAELMHHLSGAGEPIRLALYYPAFGGWREWPWEKSPEPRNVDHKKDE